MAARHGTTTTGEAAPGDPIPTLRSLPDPGSLCQIVGREWPSVRPARAVLVRSLANDVYRIDVRDKDSGECRPAHVLKVYRNGWRGVAEVAWELDLMTHLAREGVPVSRVTPRASGELVGALSAPEGPRAMALCDFQVGTKPQQPFSAGLYRAFGRLLARLHDAGDTFHSGHERSSNDPLWTLERSMADLGPALEYLCGEDRDVVHTVASAARAGLAELAKHPLAEGPTRGVCHGDATMDNILIVGGTHEQPDLVIYDFDLAGPGWTAADFPSGSPLWTEFAAGYTELRPIRPADIAALPLLDAVYLIENLNFHVVRKPAWRGIESLDEGWLDSTLADLRECCRVITG